jgi:hypothetical protein
MARFFKSTTPKNNFGGSPLIACQPTRWPTKLLKVPLKNKNIDNFRINGSVLIAEGTPCHYYGKRLKWFGSFPETVKVSFQLIIEGHIFQ